MFGEHERTSCRPLLGRSLCLLVLLLLPLGLHAEAIAFPAGYVQQRWQSSDGLPQDAIESALQTRDGYIWLATERGLARFDGGHFTVFDRSKTPGLKDTYIGAIFEGNDGTLWVGTGLNYLSAYKNGIFTPIQLPVSGMQGKITTIRQDFSGGLWIGTNLHGLIHLDDNGAEVFDASHGLAGTSVRCLLVDQTGVPWVSTEGGLQVWNGHAFERPLAAKSLARHPVSALYEDRQHTILAAAGASLFALRRGTGNEEFHQVLTARRSILTVFSDRNDDLWIGTDGGGLEFHSNESVTYFNANTNFASDTILSIFQDKEGSLWFGTDGEGLVQLHMASFRVYTQADGLRSNVIRAIAPSSDNSVWIGTNHGLEKWSRGHIADFSADAAVTSNDYRALLEDHTGTLWIGTDGSSILRMGKGEKIPRPFVAKLPSPVVMALEEDERGTLFAGTPNGLLKLGNGIERRYSTQDGLPSDVILSLRRDHHGLLWIGTSHGIASLDEDGTVHSYGQKDGFTGDAVAAIYEDSLQTIWVGTFNGLFHWTGGGFERFTTQDGLFSDVVSDIVEDNQGSFWLRSNSEVSRLTREQLLQAPHVPANPVEYDKQDGMLAAISGGGYPGSLKLEDGTIFFGSTHGLLKVDPSHLSSSSLAPPVHITDVLVDGRSINPDIIPKLSPSQGRLEFRFAALSFVEHDKLAYKYKLEGFDKNWVSGGSRSYATYTNIPPGNYTFRVIASNRDDIWNQDGASFPFKLPAHFYQTLSFYLVVAAAALALTSIALRARIRMRESALISRQSELVEVVRQRTAQLEEEKTQLMAAREELSKQTRMDGMTGLLNRVAILSILEEEMTRSIRSGRPLTVVMVDIDHFKAVNDTHGHLVGDEVIKHVSTRLLQSVRHYDAVGRYGGEEFLLILPEFSAHVDGTRLQDIRLAVATHPVTKDDLSIPVTCSMGATVFLNDRHTTAEMILAAADRSLYEAKQAGRNRVMYARSRNQSVLN